jgi:hypothetical protein
VLLPAPPCRTPRGGPRLRGWRRAAAALLAAALALALARPARAEDCAALANGYLGSAARDRLRVEQLRGDGPELSLLFLRASDDLAPPSCPDVAVQLAPVEARAAFLGGYPDDRNDGPTRSSRGVSGAATLGAVARWRFLSAGVIPTVAWSQNRSYPRRPAAPVEGFSPDVHAFFGPLVDLPMRMGSGAWDDVDPGASFARADLGAFGVGFSTEALWWGPGLRDALVLTNTGPGFPHAFAGTRRPVDVRAGRLEAQVVLGRLSTSRHWAAGGRVSHAYYRGAAISFEPAFARGLFVGFAHATIASARGSAVGGALDHLVSGGAGSDEERNSLASAFGRWVLPAARLELYGEWARDDTAALLDTLMEPGRSSAYSLGLQKLFGVGARTARLHLEHVDTDEAPPANAPNPTPIFYAHGGGTFYSHRGQSLGAGIGPSGNAQFLALDLLLGGGSRVGAYAERRLRNLRAFYDGFARPQGRDLELGAGLRQVFSRGGVDLEWQAGLAHRWNAEFLGSAWHPSVRAHVTWWPGRGARRGP